ncbi:LacI family DNA-binding transcriptional regulator [Candidatus Solirubrobacter pratensis]|uniref:LacI family DNA-binding transcriptional regulator n=1 Tax=Candidatus Solirubrobacter pratensis TaxID=1298857 RepID=UPI000406AF2C|nr:LacI family DNA-binding transcriptional regulator [Candidatus Solirubrobacter pratensis]
MPRRAPENDDQAPQALSRAPATADRAPLPSRAPTIRDVARQAGVGVGTVSRVLNDSPLVKPDKRERVHAAIAELGFVRNPTAHSLSTGRSHAIGVIAPFFTSPSSAERLRGLSTGLSERGYLLLLADVETPEQRAAAFTDLASRHAVEGLIVISIRPTDAELAALARERRPTVLVDAAHRALPHVATDDVLGGELATGHLIAKGHERIAFVGDRLPAPFDLTSSERRLRGHRRALRRAGLKAPRAYERLGGHDREEAREVAAPLFELPEPPTAVFAASDVQAIGVIEAAERAGLRVPGDLAVIGFDDIDLAAVAGLTTVRQPLRESGRRGAELLLAAIEGVKAPVEAIEPLTVIERRTT